LLVIWNVCFLITTSCINILFSGNEVRISPNFSIVLTVLLFVPASEHSFQLLLSSIINLRVVVLYYHTRPQVFIPRTCTVFSSQLKSSTKLLYAFFWVILRRLKFVYRRFGTLCLFHLHRQWLCEEWIRCRNVGVLYEKEFGSKLALPLGRWVTSWGGVRVQKQAVKGNDPHW